MQAKPRFETFKILEQYPILKDDTGNEMCLTLLEVKLPSDENEIIDSTYTYWTVIGRNKHQFNNKALAYESVAFWKTQKKDGLFKDIVQGFIIEEIQYGRHYLFSKGGYFEDFTKIETGLRTTFKISRNIKQ